MSKLKHIPTAKIKEILEENYNRGSTGRDYEQNVDELQRILWERQDKELEKQIKQREKFRG